MDDTLTVVHLTKALGIGGCNRNMLSLAKYLRTGGFRHVVVALYRGGAYEAEVVRAGVAVHSLDGKLERLAPLLRREGADVVVLHRAGKAEDDWSLVLRQCRSASVKAIVEFNVFGLPDLSREDKYIDLHLHKSKTSWLQFLARARRLGYGRLDRHRVLYNAVPVEDFRSFALSTEERFGLRQRSGLDVSSFVLLRVGRPDVRKWSDFLLEVIPLVVDKIPNARFAFLGVPASRKRWIERQPWRGACVFWANTTCDRLLAQAYQLADVLVHSSRRGETFPNTIVEAFSLGLPVVVNATPWRDNSQVEVVDHMVNGIVANTPADYAEALVFLYRNPDVRRKMGEEASRKAELYAGDRVAKAFGRIVVDLLERKGYPMGRHPAKCLEWAVYPAEAELERYRDEYQLRLQSAWNSSKPVPGGSWLSRFRWLLMDAFEVMRYKMGADQWI